MNESESQNKSENETENESEQDRIRPPSLFFQRVVAAAIALLFGIGALWLAVDVPRSRWLIPIAPFGWHRLIIIHAIAALPLAWLIGSLVPNRRYLAPVALIIGAAIALITVRYGIDLGKFLYHYEIGFLPRHFVRVFWCVAIEAPWFAAIGAGFDKERISWNAAALALVVGLFPPVFYTQRLCETRTEAAVDAWRQWRVLRARDDVWRLVDVGSAFPLGEEEKDASEKSEKSEKSERSGKPEKVDVTARMALKRLDSNYERLLVEINMLRNKPKLSKKERLLLADHLTALDAWYFAKHAIGELAEDDVMAALRMAQILQREEAWGESSEGFQHAMKLAPQSADATSMKAYIYDSLAFNAREQNQPEVAEGFYREAIEELPEYTAHFHNQLGRHFELLGRVREAEEEFRTAHETDPGEFPESEGLWHRVLSNGTPVGIFAPEASNYR